MASNNSNNTPDCTSLGMFIIDEIHLKPPNPSHYDVLGGAGSFFALGARLFSPPPLSRSIGWIVDAGSDFPISIRNFITSLDSACLIRETPDRLTTRGWNGYGEGEQRAFQYLTPKLRLDENSLDDHLLRSKSFHLICSPLRCIELVQGITSRRSRLNEPGPRPIFIWEPVPDLCLPAELENCLQALDYIDVVSPNHLELAAFYGHDVDSKDELSVDQIESYCRKFTHKSNACALVVRAGRRGCFVFSKDIQQWLPSYHQALNYPSGVVDTTGAGNGFLGGFAAAYVRNHDKTASDRLREAAIFGNIAASFMVEQVGVPTFSTAAEPGQTESWNSEVVQDRLENYRTALIRQSST